MDAVMVSGNVTAVSIPPSQPHPALQALLEKAALAPELLSATGQTMLAHALLGGAAIGRNLSALHVLLDAIIDDRAKVIFHDNQRAESAKKKAAEADLMDAIEGENIGTVRDAFETLHTSGYRLDETAVNRTIILATERADRDILILVVDKTGSKPRLLALQKTGTEYLRAGDQSVALAEIFRVMGTIAALSEQKETEVQGMHVSNVHLGSLLPHEDVPDNLHAKDSLAEMKRPY